ncbi:hypothetical protein K437DRAFT_132731 [Tilletiaria anomala UBC 951]|uniref:Uncharacterized protein n=1 Tax=Tilletiaria anomala (strain ATCC 24038 / CBS 436.72 / UBC 951) TaxID=1037660 RepID=A0A066WQM7_TILAU|nr:uncharacterized protein K437DRAFT_132731 [Tilletiaria anomala UBC 951]KDN52935.1 hypothetical protein K437DRAFT_132731 [Tilletiaria anomala UBC 951]
MPSAISYNKNMNATLHAPIALGHPHWFLCCGLLTHSAVECADAGTGVPVWSDAKRASAKAHAGRCRQSPSALLTEDCIHFALVLGRHIGHTAQQSSRGEERRKNLRMSSTHETAAIMNRRNSVEHTPSNQITCTCTFIVSAVQTGDRECCRRRRKRHKGR